MSVKILNISNVYAVIFAKFDKQIGCFGVDCVGCFRSLFNNVHGKIPLFPSGYCCIYAPNSGKQGYT